LRALIEALKPLALSDVFDVVAGTSTGAIVSCAHFLCGYTLDDISRFYMDMACQVFKNPGTVMISKDFARFNHTEGTYMQILESTEVNCPTMKRMHGQFEDRLSAGLTLIDGHTTENLPVQVICAAI
jgi:predicted acylesterase/phospholipase RssA